MKRYVCFLFAFLSLFSNAFTQTKNLAEKLGFPKDAKLLILHADDAGVSHSEDSATIAAFEKSAITSSSIMVPCPWFPEIAAYAKAHPELDWGIHLTLTSEWKNYKWGGVSPADKIPSLLDHNGYFYSSVEEFAKNAKLDEVETEIRAQIEKALSFGIKITHLDNHMGSIFASPQMMQLYQKVGSEYGLPILQPANMMRLMAPQLLPYIDTSNIVVDNFTSAYRAVATEKWHEFYDSTTQNLKPGLNEIIFHLAFDNDEMKAVTIDHPDFGALWRQNDFNYVTSDAFKALLKKNHIYLITWGDLKKTMQKH